MTENNEVGKIAIIGPGQLTVKTPEEARKMPCPLGRTFSEPRATCIADDCPLWRWRGLVATDPRYHSAIQRYIATKSVELREAGEKVPSEALLHKEAVAVVSARPLEHHTPDRPERGYCGLGGRVDGQ